jgi:hypothetical protein
MTGTAGQPAPDLRAMLFDAAAAFAAEAVAAALADLFKPVANFAWLLLILMAIILIAGIFFRRRNPRSTLAVRVMVVSGLGFFLFGLTVLAQQFSRGPDALPPRGALATNIQIFAVLQSEIVPLKPGVAALYDLQNALNSSDAATRNAAARNALESGSDDDQRAALEIVFATRDARLRQIAVLHVLKARLRQDIPIMVDASQPETELARALIGAGLRSYHVDEASSSFSGVLASQDSGFEMSGTVGLNGTVIRSSLIIARHQLAVAIDLHANDDFQLAGTIESTDGRRAGIHIPLL